MLPQRGKNLLQQRRTLIPHTIIPTTITSTNNTTVTEQYILYRVQYSWSCNYSETRSRCSGIICQFPVRHSNYNNTLGNRTYMISNSDTKCQLNIKHSYKLGRCQYWPQYKYVIIFVDRSHQIDSFICMLAY